MVSVQRAIEIRVPVHTLYSQLMQFEDYPQFMQDVESVERRDDTHLHWKSRMMDRSFEWDATITEHVPDQCIAWQSEGDAGNAGRVELQPVGPAASRLTLTMVSQMDIEPTTPAGDVKAELSERIWEDLARLRTLVENRQQDDASHAGNRAAGSGANTGQGSEKRADAVAELGVAQGTGKAGNAAGREGIDEVARLGTAEGMAQGRSGTEEQATSPQHAVESMQRDRGSPGNPVPPSGFAADSEEPGSSAQPAFQDAGDPAAASFSEASRERGGGSTQSDSSLSKGSAPEDRNAIAEEVSFDQQSDIARQVGQRAMDDVNGANEGLPSPEVIAKAAQRKRPEPEV